MRGSQTKILKQFFLIHFIVSRILLAAVSKGIVLKAEVLRPAARERVWFIARTTIIAQVLRETEPGTRLTQKLQGETVL